MSFRFREEESSTGSTVATVLLGAIAGFAVGMYVAQRFGGVSGLTARLRNAKPGSDDNGQRYDLDEDQYDEIEESTAYSATGEGGESEAELADVESDDVADAGDGVPLIEERVLEAFNNDPILADRAIDIGSVGTGVIELAGWVDTDSEAEHAVTVARGVVGVDTVINRLMIDDEEQQLGDNLRRFQEGDPALTEAHWEGQQVGTGKRRQGNSGEVDRNTNPKPVLEERWLREQEAVRNAADDLDDISAERRSKKARGKAPEASP